MIHLLLVALAVAGFVLLCAARPRHQTDLLGRKLAPAASRVLLWSGAATLTAGYVIAGVALGWGYGTVEWLGHLALGAFAAVVLLNRRAAAARAR